MKTSNQPVESDHRILSMPQTRFRHLTSPKELANGLSEGDDMRELFFSGKTGAFKTIDGIHVQPDVTSYAVDPTSFIEGFILWLAGKPEKKETWYVLDPDKKVISFEDLPAVKGPKSDMNGWRPLVSFDMRPTDNHMAGFRFTTNTDSAILAVRSLRLHTSMMNAKSDSFQFPIITIGRETFTAQGHKAWKPIFNVITWTSPPSQSAECAETHDF